MRLVAIEATGQVESLPHSEGRLNHFSFLPRERGHTGSRQRSESVLVRGCNELVSTTSHVHNLLFHRKHGVVLVMESSIPSTNKTEPSHPGTESNLDSFFKRLGQGQGSRLWTGPGRVGAVPGSLRTHLNSRSDDGIRKPTLAGSGSATTSTAKAGRIPERRTVAPAADIKNETARTAAAVGAGAAAGGGKGEYGASTRAGSDGHEQNRMIYIPHSKIYSYCCLLPHTKV